MLTRGLKADVDEMIAQLARKWLPMKVKGENEGNIPPGDYNLKIMVRPIQLWEIVYPKEHNDVVLNTIFLGHHGDSWHKRHHKYTAILRRMLGKNVKKIGKYDTSKIMPLDIGAVERIAIGIKEDHDFKDGTEAL